LIKDLIRTDKILEKKFVIKYLSFQKKKNFSSGHFFPMK
jgi:hypothetical protein